MCLSQTKQITMARADFNFMLASTMPLRLSNNLKECIIQWYYIDWMTMDDIHGLAKCSIGLVYIESTTRGTQKKFVRYYVVFFN